MLITHIEMIPYSGLCSQMNNIDITIGDNFCTNTGSSINNAEWYTFTCNQLLSGSTITFTNQKTDTMFICGLNIFVQFLIQPVLDDITYL